MDYRRGSEGKERSYNNLTGRRDDGKEEFVRNSNVAIIFFLSIVFAQNNERKEFTRGEVLEIAINALEKEGETLENRVILYDVRNKEWQGKSKTINRERAQRYEFLKDKNYQAVCFSLKEGWLGGDIWFFIDKTTGEVLILYGEE